MAKEKKEITLQEIAEEMNEVMAYGKDAETGEVDENELIDVELSDKNLKKEILKRAEEDLRAADQEDFSSEAWDWFIENGINPAGAEPADEPEDKPAPKGKSKDKSPAKSEKKSSKSDDDDGGDDGKKKGVKKAMVPGGNEAKAIEIVKGGGGYEECLAEFTKIYKANGSDKEYIAKRAKIYYNIACKTLGKKSELPSGRKGNPEALAKAREARAAAKEAEEAKVQKKSGKSGRK